MLTRVEQYLKKINPVVILSLLLSEAFYDKNKGDADKRVTHHRVYESPLIILNKIPVGLKQSDSVRKIIISFLRHEP